MRKGNIKQFQFNTHKYRKKEEENTHSQMKSIIIYACVDRERKKNKYENCGRKEWINF